MSYTITDYKRVIRLYASDVTMSTRRVEQITGINRQTICDWVRAEGLTRSRNASRQIPDAAVDEAVRIYLDKELSLKATARRTGVDRRRLRARLAEIGLLRTRDASIRLSNRKWSEDVVRRVGVLFEQGHTWNEVSERTGVPFGTLYSLRRRYAALCVQDRRHDRQIRRAA